jgi:hypothetical protein
MVKLNWGLIACGVVGAIMVLALPLAEAGKVRVMLLDVGGQGYFTLACLLAGAAMGALNLFKAPARWSGAVAIVVFLIAAMKLAGSDDDPIPAGAGADNGMLLAALGALLAIAVTIKPGKKA